MTTLFTLAFALLALYLAFKLVESSLKVIVWVLVLAVIYWAVAASLEWPPLPELIQLAWQDIQRLVPDEWLARLRDVLLTNAR